MPRPLLLGGVVLLLVTACGPPTATVSGTVTLDNKPLSKGYISFTPENDKGGTAGAEIEGGWYQVVGLIPGKYRAHIVRTSQGPIIQPGSKDAMRTLSEQEIQAMMGLFPPDVSGTNPEVEIQAGEQTRDFKLQSRSP